MSATQYESGTRVETEFGAAVIVGGMPDYPGYVYVSMPNPFSDSGRHAVLPMRREFIRRAVSWDDDQRARNREIVEAARVAIEGDPELKAVLLGIPVRPGR